MLTLHSHQPLKAFIDSFDAKDPEGVVTFVVERKAHKLTLISGHAERLHMVTLALDDNCSLNTGKFSLNASLFKLMCSPLFDRQHRAESISINVSYQNRRLPNLAFLPRSNTWQNGQGMTASERHLELFESLQSAGFESLSKCWIETAMHHTHSHPNLSVFKLNHFEEKLEIISDTTLHTFDLPYHTNPHIDLKLDPASLQGLRQLCQHSSQSQISVYADSETAVFSDGTTTVGFRLYFDEADMNATPIHYQVETTFSVPVKAMSASLGTHYQVDTLKSQNLTSLYVSCDCVLIGSATQTEGCYQFFETKIAASPAPILYSVTTSQLKRAFDQCKKLNIKEAFLQVLIAPDGCRELGLYKDTGAKHPICTVAIELDTDGLEPMIHTIEYHKTMKPAQGDLFTSE
ncbi:hypothetical protein AB4565_07890 [Vibrio breoganii]|uniref:hypothetical protein n=1 Tax=Vibrio breoganii TaxID=553239 RepID=UPI000C8478A7|nr:hypothetical protein [Vibrio breoganii]PMM86875.1 hypothetical protein BCT45_05435 [Vibrio breoganii]